MILEGNSRPQNAAIAACVEEAIFAQYSIPTDQQGDAASGWIVLDYGGIIVVGIGY